MDVIKAELDTGNFYSGGNRYKDKTGLQDHTYIITSNYKNILYFSKAENQF